MMAWHKYTIVFKLLSPLHIGYRKVSNLHQTRKYVPGKVIWAALTARITRDFAKGSDAREYQRVGSLLRQHFRFGYFYPALEKEEFANDEAPVETKEHYFWDGEAEFDYRFLNSYASTALDYDFQSAEEGSLHEVEYISPKSRPWGKEEKARQVCLKGDIYVKEGQEVRELISNWQKVISKLHLGAERNAGWGRLELAIPLTSPQLTTTPKIEYSAEQRLKEHVLTPIGSPGAYGGVLPIQGEIEPLLGWERAPDNSAGKNWQLSTPRICYPPGSLVMRPMKFKISDYYGILEPL